MHSQEKPQTKIINKMRKERANRLYNYFAVVKSTNKIVNGVDYLKKDGYTHEDLMAFKDDYFFNDLVDMQVHEILGLNKTEEDLTEKQALKLIRVNVAIKTKAQMIKIGIDPYDFDNWHKADVVGAEICN